MGASKINGKRLSENISALGEIGRNSEGGIDRSLGSDADTQARKWLSDYWRTNLSGELRIDPIANLWFEGENESGLRPIVIGSHHDAVPNGGRFDGAMGVLMATEILQTIQEQKIPLRHPVSLISFTGEEPNPFNISTLGSKVVSGKLTSEGLKRFSHRDTGESLPDAIKRLGGDTEKAESALLSPADAAAFIECHNEQGSRLEKRGLPLSNVSKITGIYREKVTVSGEANHAGTTSMAIRKDALLAAAEYSLAVEEGVKALQSDEAAATVGYMKVHPNEANIIPDRVELIMDLRISDDSLMEQLMGDLLASQSALEKKRGVKITREIILNQPPVFMSRTVSEAINKAMAALNEEPVTLVSMAGHDAANMAGLTDTGMIFVKSIAGKSHCKEEFSEDADIARAADVMLNAVLILDREID